MRQVIFLLCLLIIQFITVDVRAQEDYFSSVNYSRARPLGMGGAFTAVVGGLPAAYYNPAAFHLLESSRGIKVSCFANPIVSMSLYDLYQNDDEHGLSGSDWWNIFRTFPKAIVLSTQNWEFGLINHEELATREMYHPHLRFFESAHFFQHHVESAIVRIRLDSKVYFGASLQYYSTLVDDSLTHDFGGSYGVFLRPNPKLDVGIVFVNLPPKMTDLRLKYDRIQNETLNVGAAYHPFSKTTISFDVRNLTEDWQKTTREVHVGVEQGIWRHIYLRAGYYYDRNLEANRVTVGIGLIDLNAFRIKKTQFSPPALSLDYSLMIDPDGHEGTRWHFLSFIWGF